MSKSFILLTGGTGFLGSHQIEAFIKKSYKVILLIRKSSNLSRIKNLLNNLIIINIDSEPLKDIFKKYKINYVVHLACNYGKNNKSKKELTQSNIIFGQDLCKNAILNNVRFFINIDTMLPENLNNYSSSKKIFSNWLKLQSNQIKIVNLKVDYIFGPKNNKDSFVNLLIYKFINNVNEVRLTSGLQKRNFIYVDDVVSAIMIIIEKSTKLPNFNEFEVGKGKSIEVKKFVKLIKDINDKINGISLTKLNFGSIPYRKNEKMETHVNNKGLIELGWKSKYTLRQGLKNTLKHL